MRANNRIPTILHFLLISVWGVDANAEPAAMEKIGSWRVKKPGMKAEWKIDAEFPVFDRPDNGYGNMRGIRTRLCDVQPGKWTST